jgi:hypothetical protein
MKGNNKMNENISKLIIEFLKWRASEHNYTNPNSHMSMAFQLGSAQTLLEQLLSQTMTPEQMIQYMNNEMKGN